MARIKTNDYIDWLNQKAMRGKSFFTKDEFNVSFGNITEGSRAVALSRLVDGGWIVSLWQNFYVIVPIQYKLKGEVPPSYYIDDLMQFLGRKYYVSLLTAAGLHGAGHQRSMSFFVTMDGAALRNAVRSGTKLLMFQKKKIDLRFTQEVRTEGGYMNVSSPLMTALDLVQDERKVGGLNRVAEILYELAEKLELNNEQLELIRQYGGPILQRFGYLLRVLELYDMEDKWFDLCMQTGVKFKFVALKPSVTKPKDSERDKRWKIIINQEIDIDEI
ncbi:MAG: hypothetical protein KBT10_00325 [Bacteroidales bacterium]|nr:hypothetical protein [Candidatus Sodaliphilus aphodohippi]